MKLGIDLESLKKPQNIIIMMIAVVLLVIMFFWLFIYNPARHKMGELKGEFAAIQSEIKEIEMISGGAKNLDVVYEKLYKKFKDLEGMISADEKTILSILSSEANNMEVDVVSVKPGPLKKSKISQVADNRTVSEMPISMDLKCDYITLGEYIDRISKVPALLNVARFSCKPSGGAEDATTLNVRLELVLYILAE